MMLSRLSIIEPSLSIRICVFLMNPVGRTVAMDGRTIDRLLHTTRFARALRCAHSFARFNHSLSRGTLNDGMAIHSVFFYLGKKRMPVIARRRPLSLTHDECDPENIGGVNVENSLSQSQRSGRFFFPVQNPMEFINAIRRLKKGQGKAEQIESKRNTRGVHMMRLLRHSSLSLNILPSKTAILVLQK